MAIRDTAFTRIDELLSAATPSQMAIGNLVVGIARANDGHRVCIEDWSVANVRSARTGLPDA